MFLRRVHLLFPTFLKGMAALKLVPVSRNAFPFTRKSMFFSDNVFCNHSRYIFLPYILQLSCINCKRWFMCQLRSMDYYDLIQLIVYSHIYSAICLTGNLLRYSNVNIISMILIEIATDVTWNVDKLFKVNGSFKTKDCCRTLRWLRIVISSGMKRHITRWNSTNGSKEYSASTFNVKEWAK
jgi:hypothetical protein